MEPKNLPIKITPENTILAFDIHDVLLKADYSLMAQEFFKSPHKLHLLFSLLNPFLLMDIIKLLWQQAVAEQFILQLAQKYRRLERHCSLGISVSNAQRPIERSIHLIRQLKNKGYTLHILSNIGSVTFDNLVTKFPMIFNLFDEVKVTSSTENYLRKPDHRMYTTYLDSYNKQKKQVVFIDDKIKNIHAANRCNIIGIHFSSPEQLEKQLVDFGVL